MVIVPFYPVCGQVSPSEISYKLIDCPSRHNGQKDTIDKKIIVDVMRFAFAKHRNTQSNLMFGQAMSSLLHYMPT